MISNDVIRNDSVGLRAGAWAFLMAVLWGGNSVAIKVGLLGVPPAAMAAMRFLLGVLVIWFGTLIVGVSITVPREVWRGLVGLGLLFAIQIWLLNAGTEYTTASRSGVLINIFPFFVAIFSHVFVPGDKISSSKLFGLVCSFLGIVLLFAESINMSDKQYLLGDGMVALSGMLLGLRQVVLKRLVQGLHALQVLFWQAAIGVPLFVLYSMLVEQDIVWCFDMSTILSIFYQGIVVAGLCFVIMVSLLRDHSATQLGVFSFLTPIVGVIFSVWLLNEDISAELWISVLLVALGIIISNRAERRVEKKFKSHT